MNKTIKEVEFKLETLPEGYFLNYFESDFLPKIKKIYKELIKKCNEPADNLQIAEFQNELKKIIG